MAVRINEMNDEDYSLTVTLSSSVLYSTISGSLQYPYS